MSPQEGPWCALPSPGTCRAPRLPSSPPGTPSSPCCLLVMCPFWGSELRCPPALEGLEERWSDAFPSCLCFMKKYFPLGGAPTLTEPPQGRAWVQLVRKWGLCCVLFTDPHLPAPGPGPPSCPAVALPSEETVGGEGTACRPRKWHTPVGLSSETWTLLNSGKPSRCLAHRAS